jgi:dolichol-phosphate mannosyltransferase
MKTNPEYSIVIPAFNEVANIPILAEEINNTLNSTEFEWECIWVDDRSTDNTWGEICGLGGPHRGIRLSQNGGQSTALMAGIDHARAPMIITMDSDLQNDPADILRLIEHFTESVDVVCGFRRERKDATFSRKIPSKIANALARKVTGIKVKDLGCTLRLFRKDLILRNRLIGEMHRVLVIHFKNSGARIIEIPVNHRARKFGESKYGINRTFKFIADLILARVLTTLRSKPLYFFGLLSIMIFFTGFFSFASAFILRVFNFKTYIDSSLIVGSVILVATSLVTLSLGLVCEVLVRNAVNSDRSAQYTIDSSVGIDF